MMDTRCIATGHLRIHRFAALEPSAYARHEARLCASEVPPLKASGEGHSVACHLRG